MAPLRGSRSSSATSRWDMPSSWAGARGTRFRSASGHSLGGATSSSPGIRTGPAKAPNARDLSTRLSASRNDTDDVFVIGGSEIFALALSLADAMVITEIGLDVDGTVLFPEWDHAAFTEVAREPRVAADGTSLAFVTYERRPAG